MRKYQIYLSKCLRIVKSSGNLFKWIQCIRVHLFDLVHQWWPVKSHILHHSSKYLNTVVLFANTVYLIICKYIFQKQNKYFHIGNSVTENFSIVRFTLSFKSYVYQRQLIAPKKTDEDVCQLYEWRTSSAAAVVSRRRGWHDAAGHPSRWPK